MQSIIPVSYSRRREMYKVVFFCVLAASAFDIAQGMGGPMIGTGVWKAHEIKRCPGDDVLPYMADVAQTSLTRFQKVYDAKMNMSKDLGSDSGVQVNICVHKDGGCKPYSTLTSESLKDFLLKITESNTLAVMKKMQVEDFPIPAGEYECMGHVMDMCDFSCRAVYGKFEAEVILLNEKNEKQFCTIATVEFVDAEGDELCDKCKEE